MSSLIKSSEPTALIKNATKAKQAHLVNVFMDVIERLYQYELLKPLLDLTATLCLEKRLEFIIEPKEFYMLDEGNCVTIEAFEQSNKKKYRITIRKITPDVIIHEIGHMMEKESEVRLDSSFIHSMISDIKDSVPSNISLQSAIKNIMVLEVANYPDFQKGSELFTRYFQLITLAKEVAGHGAEYGFTLVEVYKAFPKTEDWLWTNLYSSLIHKVSKEIAESSKKYTIPIDQIKHHWAKEKIESFHKGMNKAKWSSSFKSIKDDN